jgi:hypothetical protein
MKIMGLLKADQHSEAGEPPSMELMQKMGTFIEEVAKAGVLLGTDGLHPTSKGKRVTLAGGKLTVTDGPFTESKELIAGGPLDHALPRGAGRGSVRAAADLRGVGLRRGCLPSGGRRARAGLARRDREEASEGLAREPKFAAADRGWCDR